MESNLTQTELDFKESPNQELEITLDVISCVIIIAGFIGNILNAIVWFCQRGRSPTYIYFITISISNIIYCIFYFLKYSLDTFGFLEESLEEDLCEISYDHLRYFVFHPCKEIFYTATIFYSVGLSAERFVSITKPLQFNYLCTRARTFRIITFLSFLAIAINLPLFFEYVHEGAVACRKPRKSSLRKDPIYIWTYRVVLENLLKFFIPFAVMFFFNAGIIRALKKSRQFRQSVSERRTTDGTASVKRKSAKGLANNSVQGDEGTSNDEERAETKRRVDWEADRGSGGGAADTGAEGFSRRRPEKKSADGRDDPESAPPNYKDPSDCDDSIFSRCRLVFCSCFKFSSENQRLCFLCSCYVSIFLIFILPAVTRRGLFALRSTKEFAMLDTDELDYFRWFSYFLDALRPSTDFLLYILVSTKFRASFLKVVTAPCLALGNLVRSRSPGRECRLRSLFLCGKEEELELSERSPFNHQT